MAKRTSEDILRTIRLAAILRAGGIKEKARIARALRVPPMLLLADINRHRAIWKAECQAATGALESLSRELSLIRSQLAAAALILEFGLGKADALRAMHLPGNFFRRAKYETQNEWLMAKSQASEVARVLKSLGVGVAKRKTSDRVVEQMRQAIRMLAGGQRSTKPVSRLLGRGDHYVASFLKPQYRGQFLRLWREEGLPDVFGPEFRGINLSVRLAMVKAAPVLARGGTAVEAASHSRVKVSVLYVARKNHPKLLDCLIEAERRRLGIPSGFILRVSRPIRADRSPAKHPPQPNQFANKGYRFGAAMTPNSNTIPTLSDRQYIILVAMLELGATGPATRRPLAKIAAKAEGNKTDPELLKRPLAKLKEIRLVKNSRGRAGGFWLTVAGKEVAENITTH